MALIQSAKSALAALALAVPGMPALAQSADPYPVEALAGVIGELHSIDFNCSGRDAQIWRDTMLELLEHEAPTRGGHRDRLIARFNDGFQTQQRNRTRCGAEAELQERRLANRGAALSEQLRRQYLD
jgi:uncharacterized protein (TIGR02301 family)